ncbi:hypothetical protein B0H17DRAFT_1134925 [Mycena rosella]|uniref:Retrotransposon gag domain-containing protein n=1 Tax=Mycena rosella TaxID=1033263 RepID=A0AAD7DE86_MYCRO|nr:hypothetical protein B0H17DRAFT_1134925 [Mycena rosella]
MPVTPHLSPQFETQAPTLARPHSTSPSMSKLEFPKLTKEPTPVSIHSWLGRCKDTFEVWQAQNADKKMEPHTLITLAGLRMEELTAVTWWNENQAELKKLTAWDEFAQKVKDRFVPTNWRMVALSSFYSIHQGSLSFPKFAKSLQHARNTLASAGAGYTINDSILKNHFLFHAQPVLHLRVCGQQAFSYVSMKVDGLIANMASTWESLIVERVIKFTSPTALPPLSIPSIPAMSSSSLPTPISSTPASTLSAFRPLTYAEKEILRAANNCYHCRKTPKTLGWVKHRSDTCPSNPVLRIPPCSSPAVIAAVSPAGFPSIYKEGYAPVAAVMPVYDPNEDSFSFGTDDKDLSTRNN